MTVQFTRPRHEHNALYLNRIDRTISNALNEHPRTLAVRVDLHLPLSSNDEFDRDIPCLHYDKSRLISRFIDAFKAKVKADLKRKHRAGKRVHPCSPRYVWCRERNRSDNDHFHILILLNKDTYHCLGDYQRDGNLASMIIGAWASTLGWGDDEIGRLVHFPEKPSYYIDKNNADYYLQLESVFNRASYLAKKITKCYGEGHRTFGTSSR